MCIRNLCFVGAREGGDEEAAGRRAGGSPASGAAPPGPPALVSRPALRLFPHDFSRNPCIFVSTTESWHFCVYPKDSLLNIESQCMKNTLKVIFCVESQDRRDPLRKSLEWNRKLGRKKMFCMPIQRRSNSWYFFALARPVTSKYLIYLIRHQLNYIK